MRNFLILAGTWIAIVAVLVVVWNHRFEQFPGTQTLSGNELRELSEERDGVEWVETSAGTMLKLSKEEADPIVYVKIPLPAPPDCTAIHLSYKLQAKQIIRGKQTWDDGRLNLAWLTSDKEQIQQVSSVVGDMVMECASIISLAPEPASIAQLHIAHLGLSGDFEVSGLEVTFVRQRPWWGYAAAALWLMIGGWVFVCLKAVSKVHSARAGLASLLCMSVVLVALIPGPWILKRPLVVEKFALSAADMRETPTKPVEAPKPNAPTTQAPQIPNEREAVVVPPTQEEPGQSNDAKPTKPPQSVTVETTIERKTVIQGNPLLSIKDGLKKFKGILHTLLFAGIASVLALLLGWRTSVVACLGLAAMSELCQLAFGYGLDIGDVLDVLLDALGIVIGCIAARLFFVLGASCFVKES